MDVIDDLLSKLFRNSSNEEMNIQEEAVIMLI